MSWILILLGVLAVGMYMYNVSSSMKISSSGGCSSCPKHFAKEKGF